jgi:hypothetical protein
MKTFAEIAASLVRRPPELAPEPAFECAQCLDRGWYSEPARRCLCYLAKPIEERLAKAGVGKDLLGASWQTRTGGSKPAKLATFPDPDSTVTLMGPVGTGKSHVAVALLRDWLIAGGSGRYLEASALIAECRNCYDRGEQQDAVILRYLRPGLLVLDDAWSDRPTELADDVVSILIRRRLRDRLPTVITTNLDAVLLYRTEPRICSRVMGTGALIFNFEGLPDHRQAGGPQ